MRGGRRLAVKAIDATSKSTVDAFAPDLVDRTVLDAHAQGVCSDRVELNIRIASIVADLELAAHATKDDFHGRVLLPKRGDGILLNDDLDKEPALPRVAGRTHAPRVQGKWAVRLRRAQVVVAHGRCLRHRTAPSRRAALASDTNQVVRHA